MKEWLPIIKEFTSFFGKKLDSIASRDSMHVSLEGVSVITLKGDQGEKGETGAQGPAGADGIDGENSTVPGPQGPPGKNGKDGKPGPKGDKGDTVVGPKGDRGLPGATGKDGKDGSPDTGEEIIDKINKDKSKKVIKKEKVEGLSDIESMARTAMANRGGGGLHDGVWLNGNAVGNSRLIVSATAPANPSVNDIWIDIS